VWQGLIQSVLGDIHGFGKDGIFDYSGFTQQLAFFYKLPLYCDMMHNKNNQGEKKMAEPKCETCPMRLKAEKNPKALMSRLWKWHTSWCPGWKAYQKSLAAKVS
jgi:hypothetical protein